MISYLSKYGTPVHFYNYYGFYEGSYYPRERLLSGDLVINQARHFIEKEKRLELAKAFVQGAAENIMRNLEYYNREGRAVTKQLEEIQALSARIESKETNTVQRLMALEGAIRNTYLHEPSERRFSLSLEKEADAVYCVKPGKQKFESACEGIFRRKGE